MERYSKSKWIKDLNVRPETIKLLEENIGRTLDDVNQSEVFYDPPPRVKEIWGGRREEGSGGGTHVYLWRIHFDIWQNQYNIVKLKNKIKLKKINNWGLFKFKIFCTAKETTNKVKEQPSEWEKKNSKRNNWQRINFQNMQAAHTTQFQKNKQPNQKVGKKT